MTVTLLIGNADNKLSQQEWAEFVEKMGRGIRPWVTKLHFFGGPATHEPMQNVCWVVDVTEAQMTQFRAAVADLRKKFKQDSAAVACGRTEFL